MIDRRNGSPLKLSRLSVGTLWGGVVVCGGSIVALVLNLRAYEVGLREALSFSDGELSKLFFFSAALILVCLVGLGLLLNTLAGKKRDAGGKPRKR